MGLCLPVLPGLGRGKPAFPVPTVLPPLGRLWGSSPAAGGGSHHMLESHPAIRGTGGKLGEARSGPRKVNALGLQQEMC